MVVGCLLCVKILLIFTPNALCSNELLQVGEGKKPKLGDVRARERFSAGFSDLASCGNEGGAAAGGGDGRKAPR